MKTPIAPWPTLAALIFALTAGGAIAAPKHPRGATPPPARSSPAPARPYRPAPPRDRAPVHWDHGYWHHGWYSGRMGWWWVVGPSWYYYDYPIYPYWWGPYSHTQVVVVEEPQPSGPPPTPYWYWCNDPKGYYPYVAQCPTGWTPVPAVPPDLKQPDAK